jgi:uncharacterized protein (TIGR02594 family)
MPVVTFATMPRTAARHLGIVLSAGLGVLMLMEPAAGTPAGDAQARRQAEPARLTSLQQVRGNRRPAFGWPALVTEARKYIGTNPTARKKLWCATFMNMVLAKTGYAGTGSDAARSFASYGKRIGEPRIGAIAVLTRGKHGGHVGIVTGIDGNGNPIIISGNHGRRVGEASYSRSRVIAYVMPVGRGAPTQVASTTGALRASDAEQDGGFTGPIEELLAAINAERNHEQHTAAPPPPVREAAQPVAHVERATVVPAPRPAPYRVVQQVATADVPLPRERVTPMPLPRSRPQ